MRPPAARTAAWPWSALGLALAGCAAGTTAVAKRNLDVQTKMSDTVFLDPVRPGRAHGLRRRPQHLRPARPRHRAAGQRRRRGARLPGRRRPARRALRAPGQRAAGRPHLGDRGRGSADNQGFGGTLLGGAAGGAAGYGLGAGRLGVNDARWRDRRRPRRCRDLRRLADAYVQDTTYTIVTDVQVSERAAGGTVISQSEQANLAQGTSGTVTQCEQRDHRPQALPDPDRQHRQQVNLDWPAGGAAARGRPEPQHRRHLLSALRQAGSAISAAATRRPSASSTL